jgi:hypothetical protein
METNSRFSKVFSKTEKLSAQLSKIDANLKFINLGQFLIAKLLKEFYQSENFIVTFIVIAGCM